jgi:hypothetical protein
MEKFNQPFRRNLDFKKVERGLIFSILPKAGKKEVIFKNFHMIF